MLLQCFLNFHLYLKGREELVVTVYTGPQASPRGSGPNFRAINSGWVGARFGLGGGLVDCSTAAGRGMPEGCYATTC